MSAARSRSSAAQRSLAPLCAAALLGSCYDTPLIPDHHEPAAGAAGGKTALGGTGATGGKATAGKASTGGASAGDSPGATAGSHDGGAFTGGSASAGSAGELGDAGQGGEPSVPRITWLELVGDRAPSSREPNRELGVQGSFYAYSDSCAEVHWDPAARCVSGKLCDPQLEPDAWGVAIGFDFYDTGEAGTPPDTRLIWNPDDVAAVGFAWRVSRTAPSLQVWVLNMDASWNGQCDIMTCEIDGPPDGVEAAALNGELLFSELVKDWWGGAGTNYQFDPAAVHALQFKLPAIRAGAAAFDFCVDAVGIIR